MSTVTQSHAATGSDAPGGDGRVVERDNAVEAEKFLAPYDSNFDDFKEMSIQVILPILSLFTLFRPYLAHFCPVFSRFLRVSTAWPRRFQRAPSRNPGPRNGGKGTKSGELRPSFDTPDANQRINWSGHGGTRTKTRDLGPSFDTPDANQRINWGRRPDDVTERVVQGEGSTG